MAEITLDLIKKLRKQTQVGMGDCKKALIEANGNYDEAVENLRKKGASVAAKRAENATENGTVQVLVSPDYRSGVIVEASCETDFSANTPDMVAFALDVAKHITATEKLPQGNVSSADEIAALMQEKMYNSDLNVQDKLDELISKISEKIQISRFAQFCSEDNMVNAYVHPGSNLGVLAELSIEGGPRPDEITKLVAAARDVCMQAAVTNPLCIDPEQLDADVVAKERALYSEQLREQGKPAQMIDKIVEGKMGKFYEGVCLHNQKFIKDDKMTVAQMLDAAASKGTTVRVKRFVRFSVGGK